MQKPQEKPRDLWTDEEFIKAYGLTAKAHWWPLYLGKIQRPGWSGRLKVYLVWCEKCRGRANGGYTVAHEAGYAHRLECSECRTCYDHLLPSRRLKAALVNPHRYPLFLTLLFLAVILTAIAFR